MGAGGNPMTDYPTGAGATYGGKAGGTSSGAGLGGPAGVGL